MGTTAAVLRFVQSGTQRRFARTRIGIARIVRRIASAVPVGNLISRTVTLFAFFTVVTRPADAGFPRAARSFVTRTCIVQSVACGFADGRRIFTRIGSAHVDAFTFFCDAVIDEAFVSVTKFFEIARVFIVAREGFFGFKGEAVFV